MLTGDEPVGGGQVAVDGLSVKTQLAAVRRHLGYCPQTAGLVDALTGRETLALYARLRGVREPQIGGQIAALARLLHFAGDVDKRVAAYSGGTRRKLSAAVALVGGQRLVFLDEPTTGVDPVARRCLWAALAAAMARGRSLLLTSHSMEECEALCSRLVVMVNGRLCCLGSPMHLKSKFGDGFTLLVKVAQPGLALARQRLERQTSTDSARLAAAGLEERVAVVRRAVDQRFPAARLKAAHHGLLHFHLADAGLAWSAVFGEMERAKQTLDIEVSLLLILIMICFHHYFPGLFI